MAKLTTRSLATGTSVNDLIHIVITGDTTQSVDGSSYKATISQLLPLFGGTSANCINDFYTLNIHSCTNQITIHDRVRSIGSDAQNTLSFAFGDNTQALSDFSHAEGSDTIASGSTSHAEGLNTKTFGAYSHSEGTNTRTGTNAAYLATGLTSGVLYLSNTYGNVSANFTVDEFIWINDTPFGGSLTDEFKKVSGSTFSAGQTLVYLYDTGLSATNDLYIGDTNTPNSWGGNQTAGGRSASVKGLTTNAIGTNSFASGQGNSSLGLNSFSANKSNKVFGSASSAFGTANSVYGTSSVSFGDSNVVEGDISFIIGSSNEINSDYDFAGGYGNINNGTYSFIFSNLSTINNSQGAILGGNINLIQSGDTDNSTILGGKYNTITGSGPSAPVYDSAIIGGSGNTVSTFRSVILGGTGITATLSNTVYVPNIVLAYSGTPTSSLDTLGQPGSLLWDNSYFYYKDNTGWKRLSGATW
jgi:hypothetical protein